MKIVFNTAFQDFIIEYYEKAVREWVDGDARLVYAHPDGDDALVVHENKVGNVVFYYEVGEQIIKISFPSGAFKMIADKIKEIEEAKVEPQEIED